MNQDEVRTFEKCNFEDNCDTCQIKGEVYTRVGSEGEAEGYWCKSCTMKREKEEIDEAQWFENNLCEKCGEFKNGQPCEFINSLQHSCNGLIKCHPEVSK